MLKIVFSLFITLNFVLAKTLSIADAFGLTTNADEQNIEFKFDLAEDIYVYKDSLKVKSNSEDITKFLNFPPSSNNGEHEIIMQKFSLFVPMSLLKNINKTENFTLTLEYQGCAKDGICYQPQIADYSIKKSINSYNIIKIVGQEANIESMISEQDNIANNLDKSSFILSLITFFGYGVLLSLTPCIFPMIPILSSIIVAKSSGEKSIKKGFILSLIYVLGMSVAYAIAGILASIFGQSLQTLLQTPIVLLGFSCVFILLALAMFGVYELQLPVKMQNFLNQKSRNNNGFIGVFLMGFLAALIASPCVAAPIAGALLYIANSGNIALGGIALFFMGFGMGLPLLVIGISSGKILPRPGIWMENIKKLFGFIMIFMAIWLSSKVLGNQIEILLYGITGVFMAVFFGAFDSTNENSSNLKRVFISVLLILFIYSNLLIIGSFLGSKSLVNPLSNLTLNTNNNQQSELNFIKVSSLTELKDELNKSQKPIMVDFFATWCASCVELDEITFSDKEIRKKLEDFTLLRIDVSGATKQNEEILKEFSLIGPPAILFFKANSQVQDELKNARLIGFYPPNEFLEHLNKINF